MTAQEPGDQLAVAARLRPQHRAAAPHEAAGADAGPRAGAASGPAPDPVPASAPVSPPSPVSAPGIVRTARFPAQGGFSGAELRAALGQDLALVLMFVPPDAGFAARMALAAETLPEAELLGCTTAGEIFGGYVEDQIIAVGFPRSHFMAAIVEFPDLGQLATAPLVEQMIRARQALQQGAPAAFAGEFAVLISDGTSFREDALMQVIGQGLGPVPLFGGSAGDGRRFGTTHVAHGARCRSHAAILAFLRTRCPVEIFSFDHLDVSERKMVVTAADPARRKVTEINGAPAAGEYARILGKAPGRLDPFVFAAHPLVVRAGGRYHVRSIRRVENDTDLVFFSAIEEGLVLTLANPRDMASTLDRQLSRLAAQGGLDRIIACDCILRRIEAEQKQQVRDVSEVLSRHRVAGFSTYGEQFGAMHVNLTMTGIAIFDPDAPLHRAADTPAAPKEGT